MLKLAPSGLKPREQRVRVVVPCRLQHDGRWADACIHNISSRGLLVAADVAPAPGSYVDIRRGTLVIIGRVCWRKDRFFGLRTQDRVSVDALVGEPRRTTAPTGTPERRAEARHRADAEVAERIERHRRLSSLLQYGSLVGAVAIGALIAASQVFSLLSGSLGTVSAALAGPAG